MPFKDPKFKATQGKRKQGKERAGLTVVYGETGTSVVAPLDPVEHHDWQARNGRLKNVELVQWKKTDIDPSVRKERDEWLKQPLMTNGKIRVWPSARRLFRRTTSRLRRSRASKD